MTDYNLSTVFGTVAAAIPDAEAIVFGDRRITYREIDAHATALARHFVAQGLGLRSEREGLAGHESGQDHLGVYLRNGGEYIETLVGSYRARVAPFNVNYRYVEDELLQLLRSTRTAALVFHAEFAPRVQAVRDRLPDLRLLVQVADESGEPLLPGAMAYESLVGTPGETPLPTPSGDDLYLICTGGTTGLPRAVMWRQHDIYVSSMGGTPFGADQPFDSYESIAASARANPGGLRLLMPLPFMHGAAQWSAFHMFTNGGTVLIPRDVHRLDPADALSMAARERATTLPVVGDAIALPFVEELERAARAGAPYDLSGLAAVTNASAALNSPVRARLMDVLPHVLLLDSVGASESGIQMASFSTNDSEVEVGVFSPMADTAVLDESRSRLLGPGESMGWLARRGWVPLGYFDDEAKTAATFPTIDGVRWSVPGDRAEVLDDGRVRLLGRDGVTINSGGEKIFAEEVERAVLEHPAVRDALVVGRPSERWGTEVVAVVELEAGAEVSEDQLLDVAARHVARYKLPKSVVLVPKVQRSPSGKADYRWARETVTDERAMS